MDTQLVEIVPREIKFMFEVKKQSSCAVQLTNVTEQYIAFKVKTTSPKKYSVRPNVGIIKPKSKCDFIVTMQALKYAPSEMLCKDKFLIQSTVVPFGTTEGEIMPGMFAKGIGKHIEESKLPVALTSAPTSPEKLPTPQNTRQKTYYETSSPENSCSPVLPPVNRVSNQESSYATSQPYGVENIPPPDMLIKKVKTAKTAQNADKSLSVKIKDNMRLALNGDEFYVHKDEESNQMENIKATKLNLTQDVEHLKLEISALNSKLIVAKSTIARLQEVNMSAIHGKDTLLRELSELRRKTGVRKVQVGFPPLFVCMVALISLMIGIMF